MIILQKVTFNGKNVIISKLYLVTSMSLIVTSDEGKLLDRGIKVKIL